MTNAFGRLSPASQEELSLAIVAGDRKFAQLKRNVEFLRFAALCSCVPGRVDNEYYFRARSSSARARFVAGATGGYGLSRVFVAGSIRWGAAVLAIVVAAVALRKLSERSARTIERIWWDALRALTPTGRELQPESAVLLLRTTQSLGELASIGCSWN